MCWKEAIQNKMYCPETLISSGKEIFITLVQKKHCITDENIWFGTQNLFWGHMCVHTHIHIKTLFKTIKSDNKFISKEYNDVNPQKKVI